MRGRGLGFSDLKDKGRPALSALFNLTILLAALFYACPGAASESGRITNIEISDYTVEVRADSPIKYSIVKSDDPFKFIVMLEGITAGDYKNRIFSRSAGITEIAPSFTLTPVPAARLEILLQTPSVVSPEVSGNVLTLRLEHDAVERPKVALAGSEAAGGDIEQATAVKEVTFARKEGGMEIVLKADGTTPEPVVFEVDGGLVIDIPDIAMEAVLPKAFPPPLKGMRVREEKDGIRLVVDTQSGYNTDVYSLDDEIIIDISSAFLTKKQGEGVPVSQAAEVPMPESKGNQLVSLDFQDGDIVPILRLLADVSGYNIVIHPEVRGRITMKLLNVRWDQALDLVLKTFALEKLIDGNIIRVAPAKAFHDERRIAAEKKEDTGKTEDIATKVFRVNYGKVAEVEATIRKVLSPKGTTSIDTRTSSIIVKDIISKMDEVRTLVDILDKPTPQVIIDARIVEADTDNTRELGIEWGSKWLSGDGRFAVSGSTPVSLSSTLGAITPIVSLPAGAVAGALTLGYLNPNKTIGLNMRLSAFENAGLVKIISQPHIMTIENEAAMIKHGASIPVTTAGSANSPATTSYQEANLSLNVTPNVTPDDSVFLTIDITNDNPNYALRDPLTGSIPIDKRQAKTKVLIKDGATLVIGGIVKSTESDSQGGVPFLSKIPGLGWLFKNQSKTKNTSEVLIFITPRIVRTQ